MHEAKCIEHKVLQGYKDKKEERYMNACIHAYIGIPSIHAYMQIIYT
jgi:hypothetical protein